MSWITELELTPDEIDELAWKQADEQPGRTRSGLGVEPAEGRQEWVEEWLQGPARDQKWLLEPKT